MNPHAPLAGRALTQALKHASIHALTAAGAASKVSRPMP